MKNQNRVNNTVEPGPAKLQTEGAARIITDLQGA